VRKSASVLNAARPASSPSISRAGHAGAEIADSLQKSADAFGNGPDADQQTRS
jgi:hypothetical protein